MHDTVTKLYRCVLVYLCLLSTLVTKVKNKRNPDVYLRLTLFVRREGRTILNSSSSYLKLKNDMRNRIYRRLFKCVPLKLKYKFTYHLGTFYFSQATSNYVVLD